MDYPLEKLFRCCFQLDFNKDVDILVELDNKSFGFLSRTKKSTFLKRNEKETTSLHNTDPPLLIHRVRIMMNYVQKT
jgi:hypothetical protein